MHLLRTTPPGTPSQVGITSNSVTVSWAAATHDVGVAFYDIYGDNHLCVTVSG